MEKEKQAPIPRRKIQECDNSKQQKASFKETELR